MTRPNHTAATHTAKALSHLEAAKAARLHLEAAYARRPQDKAEIADLHQAVGFGLKCAEIHALLALGPAEDQHPPASAGPGAGYTSIRDERRFGANGSRLS